MMVMRHCHGNSVIHVGDVCQLTVDKLKTMVPVDLLIGGSLCNDFSIANPVRQRLKGASGQLFYEFYQVLVQLQKLNPTDRHLYWLFENVASMQPCVRQTISTFFECEATLWDAKQLQPLTDGESKIISSAYKK